MSALLSIVIAPCASADDWKIVRLSGTAMVFSEGRWTPLRLGDAVTDASAIRTLADGSLRFERDRETIDVEPDTEIRIHDRAGQRFTTVQQYFGTVGVEANRENVQHFAVKTPYLAAVVKGTVFAVKTEAKLSAVAVTRGKVGVTSALGPAHGDVSAGQTATVSTAKGFSMGHAASTAAASTATATPSVAAAVAAATTAAASTAASTASSTSSAAASAAASASTGGASSGAASSSAAAGGGAAAASPSQSAPASAASPSSAATSSAGSPSAAAAHGNANGHGDGTGHGHGDGDGHGHGDGDGHGNSSGNGHGNGNAGQGGHGGVR